MKKVAMVTGGSRGIGYGISECLARDGYDLAVCGRRRASEVSDTLAELFQFGPEVHYCRADISVPADRERFMAETRQRFGQVNVLVNNAGMAPAERKDILEATEESFEQVMRVNAQGPYFLTQQVAGWMIEQKKDDAGFRGCIVNISSVSAVTASTNRGEYCLSKAALSMSTRLWACRLGEFDIPVYEVRPGLVQTDMTAGVREKYDERIQAGLLVQSRWGTPLDVGEAVSMLARGDLSYSTGQVITVDGGLSLDRL